jgi:hypothetical protein
MTSQPINQRYNESVVLDASGNGSVDITMRADFVLQNTRWVVAGGTGTNQVTANNLIDSQPWDGTYSGDNDQSGKTRLLPAQTVVTCQWTGGRPGGTATLYLWGVEYPAGQGVPPPASGEGPSNPIVGGQTLIRDAIQSSNFVAGVSGWAIMRDGSYEFGPGGTFRGNIEVDGTDGSKVIVEADGGHAEIDLTPPSYTPNTLIPIPSSIGAGSNGTGNGSFATLDLDSGEVLQLTPLLQSSRSFISLQSSTLDHTFGSTIIVSAQNIQLGDGNATITINDSVSRIPGTWVAGAALTANSAGVAATETVVLTAKDANNAQPTYLANHYYRFEFEGQSGTTATTVGPILGIRKTNAAGTRYKWARQNNTTAAAVPGTPYAAHISGEFQVGPSGQAADIVLTLQGAAGQTVTLIATAADNPGILNIYDMGPTSVQKALYLPVL